MLNLQPKDIIAAIGMIGVVISQFAGFAGSLDALISLAIGFYFGHRKTGHDTGK